MEITTLSHNVTGMGRQNNNMITQKELNKWINDENIALTRRRIKRAQRRIIQERKQIKHTNQPITEDTTRSICTTRHNCPAVEKLLGYKPQFLGYVPTTSNIDYKGYRWLFKVETKTRKFLLWSNTIEETARTIKENDDQLLKDEYITPENATHFRVFKDFDGWAIDAADYNGNYSEYIWTHYNDELLTKEMAIAKIPEFAKEYGRSDIADKYEVIDN